MTADRPHLLGIDDAPFEKQQGEPVPIVAVMMEGADIVEGVAVDSFPVDGEGATRYLASWIRGLRFHASVQGVVLGGITMAGLGVVDAPELSQRIAAPVLVVTRHPTADAPLIQALEAASLAERIPIVERSPDAVRLEEGLYLACAGVEPDAAGKLVRASLGKAQLPEPLRIAHLMARALVRGQSRGRV